MTTTENTVNLKLDVRTPAGKTDGAVELPAEIFGVEPNLSLMHQVVVAQLAAARQGTHSTKTRGEVSGGGRKPFRQKGTGRARQGSTRAPAYTGGGTVHGPKPRDYSQRTPKKMKAAALRGALTDRVRHDRIHVVEGLVEGDKPSTKSALAALAGLTDRRRFLVVLERADIYLVSDLPDDIVRRCFLTPFSSAQQAYDAAVRKTVPPIGIPGVQPGRVIEARYLVEDELNVSIGVQVG